VLASLVGTDEYWVEISVPVDELKWISIPEYNQRRGAPVRVYHESAWGPDTFRRGSILRLMPDLEPQGRMSRLLVSVRDPLQLEANVENRHPLILGSYVRVEIEGPEVQDIVKVPRAALREGSDIWVMGQDAKLDIRAVRILWSGNDHVYVSDGLDEGDRLVVSNIGAPVQGMNLRTADSHAPPVTESLHEEAQTEDRR